MLHYNWQMTESNGQKGHHREVLIVGAGPTGLCTAIELHRHGIPFRLIDKNAQPSPYSKALAIHARTLEIFEIMGVSSALVAHGKKLRDVNISLNGKKLVSWNMDGLETAYPYILSLPQSDTERILIDHLHALGSAVERQVELVGLSQTQSEVTARLRHVDENGDQRIEEVKTPWLIACDGAHSTTRHALSLTFFGSQYPELFLLADAYLDSELSEDGMHLYNGDDGLLAIFPYGNKRFRIIADMPLDLKKEAAVRRISESTGASSKSQSQRALSASSIQSRKEPTQEEMQAIIDRRASSKVKIV
ncbi:MAG TPA: FAD-dependent monooxygenase, partial [Chroococcales cyanobacterium]